MNSRAGTWIPRIPMPLPGIGIVLLAAAYCLLGLGHAPWKTEDAVGIGIVHEMLMHPDLAHWLVPHLAGEPFLEDGPLFYMLAAATAKLFSFGLPVHDGARLGCALALAATLWFSREATREFFGEQEADSAVLLLMGCLGLFARAHLVDGENGALAGAALAWYGFARAKGAPRHEARAGFKPGLILGAGLAVVLLAKGPGTALPLLAAAIVAPLLSDTWRTRAYLACVALATAIAALLFLAWLAALEALNSGLATEWWRVHTEVFAAPELIRLREQVQLLSWAVWPLWPVALWALWDRRRRLRSDSSLILAAGTVAALALFLATRDVNEIYAMPLMLPLAILAGAGFTQLRRGAANALMWFGAMTFCLLAGLAWLAWFAMMTGIPAQIAANIAKLEPGNVPRFSILAFALALALSLGWLGLLAWSRRSPLKGASIWAAGVTLVWGLAMTLLVGWIDYGKSYAHVAESLKVALAALPRGCVASRNLGPAQRAAFHYHAGIVTERSSKSDCKLLLVQGLASRPDRTGPGWELNWEGSRPRDRERYRLYSRQ
jgi:4-amino-4-deoxy-L-arabinose transferase-like glycosyltransferase